jgi:hypothetical protein
MEPPSILRPTAARSTVDAESAAINCGARSSEASGFEDSGPNFSEPRPIWAPAGRACLSLSRASLGRHLS